MLQKVKVIVVNCEVNHVSIWDVKGWGYFTELDGKVEILILYFVCCILSKSVQITYILNHLSDIIDSNVLKSEESIDISSIIGLCEADGVKAFLN